MRLLIIEDDKPLANEMKTGLERQGFTIDIANTGLEGEEKHIHNYTVKFKWVFKILFIVSLSFVLCACRADNPEMITLEHAALSEDPDMLSRETVKSPEQVLLEQPVDDNHDAFLVDTGGELGTLLVTAELDEENPTEICRATVQFTVWDPYSMDEPLQTLTAGTDIFLELSVIDANFDGYMDFACTYLRGNQPYYDHLWIWNEYYKQFDSVPEYDKISMPTLDEETETIYGFNRSSASGTGEHTFHQWVEGKLLCMRRITIYRIAQGNTVRMSIQDRVAGELAEIYHEDFPSESGGWLDAQMAWHDLDYHGELTEEN